MPNRFEAPRWMTLALSLVLPLSAAAQGDDIQVYDASLEPVGVFNLTLHNNFTPDGLKTPSFPGAITSDRSLSKLEATRRINCSGLSTTRARWRCRSVSASV